MKYCYQDSPDVQNRRLCLHNCEDKTCYKCSKVISDCEYVTCWGLCMECMDAEFDKAFDVYDTGEIQFRLEFDDE